MHAVVGGQRHAVAERAPQAVRWREHGRHRAAAGQGAHERPPPRREPQPGLEIEGTGRVRRGDLAHAVPEHHVGTHADARPQRGQRGLQGVERGLRPLGAVKRFPASPGRIPEHHLQQRPAPFRPERRLAPVQHLPRNRLALVELPTHAEPLAPLPRVEEGNLGLRRPLHGGPARAAMPDRLELLPQPRQVSEDDPRPSREVAAPDAGRPSHVREGRVAGGERVLFKNAAVPVGEFAKRTGGPRRQRQQPVRSLGEGPFVGFGPGPADRRVPGHRPWRDDRHARRAASRVPLHHHVRVRARVPERTHRGAPRTLRIRPTRRLRRHPHRQLLPVQPRVRALEVQVRGGSPPSGSPAPP